MDLMGAFPGREFRMVQIVRYATQGRTLNLKERRAARKAIQRVLHELVQSGSVVPKPPAATRGAPVLYAWK
jgi:hypothetical protein